MLEDNLRRILDTLKRESAPYGRPPKLIAVTKTVEPARILPLADLGVTDIGENRVQSLMEKLPALEGKFSAHMIGRLQRNKVKYIIREVCLIHSVDDMPLAQEIDRQAQKNGLVMPVLLQVNIAGEAQKGGVTPEGLLPLLRDCARLPGIKVKGLMTILPLGAPREELLQWFIGVRQLLERCQSENVANTDMTELSMGMSQDYDLAASAGATMVRVGSALFKETSGGLV